MVVTEDPQAEPEKDEVLWTEEEINVLTDLLEGVAEDQRDMVRRTWLQYVDAVKRMYRGAKLKSINPLAIEHPELTPERLQRIPWQWLPRR